MKMGREGKSLHNAQGMKSQSWLPDGPDDARPPRLPRQRLEHARKLGQRLIKHMQFCNAPAAGDSRLKWQPMEVWWPYFTMRMCLDTEDADYGGL